MLLAWFWLIFAIGTEVVGTTALAYTEGRFRLLPVIVVVVGYVLSFYGLAQALRSMDVAVVYAIWSAIGTAAVAVIGSLLFGQHLTPARVGWLVVIVVGVVGLQLSGARPDAAA